MALHLAEQFCNFNAKQIPVLFVTALLVSRECSEISICHEAIVSIKKSIAPFAWFRTFTVLAGMLCLFACSPPAPIVLGFVGALSGRVADLGVEGRNGVTLAVELRNKAGGVKGRQVELLAEDDQQNPAMARQAVGKLIDLKVDALIGPMTSAMAMVVVPQVNQAQLVMVSPTVTTKPTKEIPRLCRGGSRSLTFTDVHQ